MFTDRKVQYICELKIDGKIIDKIETDDYGNVKYKNVNYYYNPKYIK